MKVSELKIGDKVMRRRSSDKEPEWVETTINETYLQLIKEFPDDYKPIDNLTPVEIGTFQVDLLPDGSIRVIGLGRSDIKIVPRTNNSIQIIN